MSNIKQITLPDGNTYDLVDAGARSLIAALEAYTDYLGVTTTALSDGSTTNPVTINGESVTAKTGNIVNYGSKEFIWNGTAWQEFGDLSALGELAYEDTAEGSYTPAGTVSKPDVDVTPSDTTVNSITDVGTLPTFTVANEVLTLAAGTLPTKGSDTTVLTAVTAALHETPAFTGTAATITVSAPATP